MPPPWPDKTRSGWQRLARAAGAALGERRLRLGITGLSGAGKTVFTTSLVQALAHAAAHPAALPLLADPPARIAIEDLPGLERFPQSRFVAGLTGAPPVWPEATRAVTGLRLRLHPAAAWRGLVLELVDYPGEWLLDHEMLALDYAAWSAAALARLQGWGGAVAEAVGVYLGQALGAAGDPAAAPALLGAYAALLRRLRADGIPHLQPARLLVPEDPAAPDAALALAPAPLPAALAGSALHAAMARRHIAYGRDIVAPFAAAHLARLDRQVVLFDALGALARGPAALAAARTALVAALGAFRYRRIPGLDRLRTRIDRVLVLATKIDHVTTSQYLNVRQLVEGSFASHDWARAIAVDRLRFDVVAAIRATEDGWMRQGTAQRAALRGRLKDGDGRAHLLVPGDVPPTPPAAADWPEGGFVSLDFAPPDLARHGARPFPHVNLDKALDHLLGDRLR
jgi:predicted YcjX-like family ATPase